MIKNFLKEEDGMGTAEVVVISAVLVAMALIFKGAIKKLIDSIIENNLEPTDSKFNF